MLGFGEATWPGPEYLDPGGIEPRDRGLRSVTTCQGAGAVNTPEVDQFVRAFIAAALVVHSPGEAKLPAGVQAAGPGRTAAPAWHQAGPAPQARSKGKRVTGSVNLMVLGPSWPELTEPKRRCSKLQLNQGRR